MSRTSELEEAFLAMWRMQCRFHEMDIVDPVQEYQFAKELGRKWRFDFAWPRQLVAVEIEGGSWVGGRHGSGAGFSGDCDKYNTAAALGWFVLRFTGRHLRVDPQQCFELIIEAMNWYRTKAS